MDIFPRTNVEHISLPRLIIGTNWHLGFSHQTQARDKFIKGLQTPSKIADILEVFLEVGIDACIGLYQNDLMAQAIDEAQQRTGKPLTVISSPHLPNLAGDQAGLDAAARVFDEEARRGTKICMPHQCSTDALLDRTTRKIRDMDKYCAMIRQRGMVPGLSTHMPEAIPYADENDLDVGTYVQLYNAIGFLMQVEVDWVHWLIQNAKKPVLTIKPLAAGRLHPLPGLAFAWATIRDCDMVAVGTMTPDEAREVIAISFAQLEHRASRVELQRTRSKASIAPDAKSANTPRTTPSV